MSVTFNPNANWNSLVGEAMQGTALARAGDAKAVQGADGNLTVTFTGANGLSQTVTIAPPALDEATGTLTEEGLADLRAKLDGAFDALKAALGRATTLSASDTAPATDAQKMLFDIYALMQLMLEIAQKERESARTQRQADLSREVADIRCQAEQQRTAARTGLIMSCVFSAASICAQAGTFFASSAAQASAAKMTKASGVDQAQQNLSLLSAKNGAETGANLTKAGKSMTPGQLQAAKANFAKSETAKATLDNAVEQREAHIEASARGKAITAELDGKIAPKQAEVDRLTVEVETLESDIAQAGEARAAVGGKGESALDAELAEKKTALTKAQGELDGLRAQREDALEAAGASDAKLQALNEKVKTANDAYVDALNLDQSQLEAKLGAKRLELTQLERDPATNKAEIKAAKAEIADLEQQRTWGRAYVTDQKMKGGYTDSLAADIEAAEQSFGKATKMLEHDAAYKAAEARAHGWQTAGDLLRQTGQLLDSVTQSVTGMQQAAATEYEAAAKTAEDARAESDDLAASAQQLVQSVLDLLQAILAAENQSINQIVA
ncbi:MAG: hypothetical protein Q4G55_02325 [bacterium]|nr:hypothetical protein [bacterium]